MVNKMKPVTAENIEQLQEMQKEAIRQENNINIGAENSEAVERNLATLDVLLSEYETEDENGNPYWKTLTSEIRSRINAVDDDGEHSDEIQEKTEQTIWEIAKQNVFTARSFDFSFMAYKNHPEVQKAILEADLKDYYADTTARLVGATAGIEEEPNGNDDYTARIEASLAAIDKFIDENNHKATIKTSAVIAAATHMSNKLDSMVEYVKSQKYSEKVVGFFQRNAKGFFENMKGLWGKAFTGFKEHIKHNKARIASDTIASAGMFVASTAFPIAAPIAYGAYAAAGSYLWPVIEKKNKMEKAYEKKYGDASSTFKKMNFFKKCGLARQFIKKNEKENKHYLERARWSAVAGAATAGILGGWGASAMANAANPVITRSVGVVSRSIGGLAAQLTHFFGAKNSLKKENTAENRADYKTAAWNLGIGGTVSAVFAGIGLSHVFDASAMPTDIVKPHINLGDSLADNQAISGDSIQPQHNFTDVDSIVNSQSGNANVDGADVAGAGVDAQPTEIDIPDQPISISQEHWDELHRKVTGIFANHAEIFGLDNRNPDEAFAQMWTNIENAKAAGILPADKPTDEILYQYEKLIEYTERAVPLKGTQYLKTLLGEDGKPMYWVDNEQMAALNDIILCGKNVKISVEDLTNSLNRIDVSDGTYHGAGEGIGGTNNYFVGYGRECDDGVNAWKQGVQHVAKVAKVPTPAPEPTPDADIVQKPTVTEVKQPDANIDVMYKQEKIVGGTAPAADGFKSEVSPLQQIKGDVNNAQTFGNWVKINQNRGHGM